MLGVPWVKKIIVIDWKFLGDKFLRIFAASSLTGWILFYLEKSFNMLNLIFIGVACYLIIIFAVKAISFADIKNLVKPRAN